MNAYLNTVVVTVIVCQIVTMFTPDKESLRRYVRLLCALVVILTLASPIVHVIEGAEVIASGISEFFDGRLSSEQDEGEGDGSAANLAYVIMRAVSDEFGIDAENMRLTLVTDESGALVEIQLYLKRTAYADRERVREALAAEFEIPVYVFSER
ncbi:MAG: stage III sporulation protein AF [Clostridia bacterium]|nr:stage III sporulation protein AF [Clostridia bacterium]